MALSPETLFATSKAQTILILDVLLLYFRALVAWAASPGSPRPDVSLVKETIATHGQNAIGRAFWTSVRRKLEVHPILDPPQLVQVGFPIFNDVFNSDSLDPLEAASSSLFTQKGHPKKKKYIERIPTPIPSSRSVSPVPSIIIEDPVASTSQQKGKGVAFGDVVGDVERGANERTLNDDIDEAIQRSLQSPRPTRPTAASFDEVHRPAPAQPQHHPRPVPRLVNHDEYESGEDGTVDSDDPNFRVPDDLYLDSILEVANYGGAPTGNRLADRTQNRAAAFRRRDKKDIARIVEVYNEPISREVRKDILLNHYVDFEKIAGFSPSLLRDRTFQLDGDGEFVVVDSTPSRVITTGLGWVSAFDTFTRYALRHYPFRLEEFESYKTFIVDLFTTHSASASQIIALDVGFRQKLGLPGRGLTLFDIEGKTSLLVQFLSTPFDAPAPASSGNGSQRSGKRQHIDEKWDNALCMRFNRTGNDDHGDGKDCSKKHEAPCGVAGCYWQKCTHRNRGPRPFGPPTSKRGRTEGAPPIAVRR